MIFPASHGRAKRRTQRITKPLQDGRSALATSIPTQSDDNAALWCTRWIARRRWRMGYFPP